jgi:outer membrane protein TolC
VLRAKVESLKAANAVRVAARDVDMAKVLLKYHLARGKDDPLQVTGRLGASLVDLNLERLQEDALSMRPELKKLHFSVQKELHIQQNARLSNLPDLDFNASVHRIENEPTSWSFTVSVPLPFLFKQRQNAEIAEAKANIGALQWETDQTRNTIRVEVETAYTNAQKARDEIALYQNQILPQAQEVYDMFLFSYQEGEIGGIELIEARRTLNDSRRSYADALFEYNLALASVEKAVGRMP